MPRVLAQHDAATIAGAGVFLDNAVYFSFSINFASILFNYHAKPLLYEDKLGQISSLLGIDAPVAIALMSYHVIDRRVLRSFLVLAVALMTFVIQCMFRKSRSFDPSTSLCLDWKGEIQQSFVARFIAKAVWAGLVVTFFASTFFEWGLLSVHPQKTKTSKSRNAWWQRTRRSVPGMKGKPLPLKLVCDHRQSSLTTVSVPIHCEHAPEASLAPPHRLHVGAIRPLCYRD